MYYIDPMNDSRYRTQVPSGIVKNPKLHTAGVDLWPDDVVWLDADTIYPMYDDSHEMYGVVLGRAVKPAGATTLVATGNL